MAHRNEKFPGGKGFKYSMMKKLNWQTQSQVNLIFTHITLEFLKPNMSGEKHRILLTGLS